MRFKGKMEVEHGLKQMDIVPLINVIFLLLIFFMLTFSSVVQPGIKVNLPKALTSEAVRYENIELLISADDNIYLNGRVLKSDDLKNFLNQVSKRSQSLLIKADRRVAFSRVVEVWDIARGSGIAQVNIATAQE